MDSTFFGKDGFIWWKGVVENRKDPLFLGRVKVRIFGWHTEDKLEMPTDSLPWAVPSLPIDNGRNPVGLKEGDWCWGFFMDGPDAQKPVVVGFIPGIDSEAAKPDSGYNDPTPDEELAPGKVPRPPEMVPPAEAEEPEGAEGAGGGLGRFNNPDRLPGNNIAFGQLTKDYDASKYKFDVNKDGVYDQADADKILDIDGDGTPNNEQEFFDGTVKTQAGAAVSRYPLETRLNEPMTSRLARNEKIEETLVGIKQGDLGVGEAAGYEGSGIGDEPQPAEGFTEPETPYAAQYPYNHVYESESGHVIEVDDTPGAERLHWYHRSGTFREIHPDGTQVNKVKKAEYNFIYDAFFNYTEKTISFHANEAVKVKAGTGMNLNAGSAINIQCGSNLNATVGADMLTRVAGTSRTVVGGDCFLYVEGGKLHIQAAKEIVIHSDASIEMKAKDGISLIAPKIALQGDGGETEIDLVSSVIRANYLTAHKAGIAMVGQPEIPQSAVPTLGVENEASKDVEEPPTEDSKKYGFLLPNATPLDVWKPESDSDGNLVTLSSLAGPHIIQEALPTGQLEAVVIKYQHPDGEVTSWEVVRPQHTPGDVVETGEYKGMFLDGVRHMYRWSKPGKEYPKQCFWINGGGTESLILDSAVRHQCFPPAPFNEKIPFNLNQTKPNDDEGTPTPTIPSGTNPGNPGNSDGGGGL